MNIVLYVLLGIVALILLHLLVLVLCSVFVFKKEYSKPSKFYDFVLDYHIFLIVKFSRIKIKVSGKEKIENLDKFLIVSNHRSAYDPIVLRYALKNKKITFISKPSNFKTFVLGGYLKRCLCVPIDRENPRKAILALKRASEILNTTDKNICVYPEGTRSANCEILPLHDGVFKIAGYSKVPIVVATVSGTEKIKKRLFGASPVKLDIHDVITCEQVENLSTHEIGDIVKTYFEKADK